jgi:hypothetical protein
MTTLTQARITEHRRACLRVTQHDQETAAWLAANYPDETLTNLDAASCSPEVRKQPREIAETPADFARSSFSFGAGISELESHYAQSEDDTALALIDHRLRQLNDDNRKARLRELTGKGDRTNERAVASGTGAIRANLQQVLDNAEVPQGRAALGFLDALPDELQHAVAERAQREADLRAIRKIVTANARAKRLSEGALCVLDKIGRNDRVTRRRLAELATDEQSELLADLVAEWREELKRAREREWRKQRAFEQAI